MVIITTTLFTTMTSTNSNRVKNKVILSAILITAVVVTGVFLASPVISFVTAIQSSNMTINEGGIFKDQSPKINGSINIFEKAHAAIEKNLKTTFVQAADIASRELNNDTILVAGHLGIDQGYLVYKFFTINPTTQTGILTIVDPGNGAVLYKSESLQLLNFLHILSDQGMGHGIYGFSGEHGNSQGQGQGHETFGFGHWKSPWGFHDHDGRFGDGPWH